MQRMTHQNNKYHKSDIISPAHSQCQSATQCFMISSFSCHNSILT